MGSFLPGIFAFALSVLLTYAVRALSPRWGWVAIPTRDRWHRGTVATGGGLAIGAAFLASAVALGAWGRVSLLLAFSSLALVGGMVDDRLRLFPPTKIVAQIIGAALVVLAGYALPVQGGSVPRVLLSILWIVGLTNAVNLMDNMDGLAGGIAFIAAVCFSVLSSWSGAPLHAGLAAGLAGAAAGFLVFNFPPATIFMGNAGSYFLGFTLAVLGMGFPEGATSSGSRLAAGSQLAVLAPPVLILLLPIFDTTLVTLVRKLQGRPISEGGKDHSSHRLVARGLTERKAVLVLYGMAALSGVAALLARAFVDLAAFVVAPLMLTAFTLLGVWLAGVRVGAPGEASPRGPFVELLADVTYKRRVFEVVLDLVLIAVAYQGAYLLRFEGTELSRSIPILLESLPVVIACQALAFLAGGLYRGVWRYMGLADIPRLLRAVLFGVVLTLLAVLYLWRFEGFSRTVFLIDALLLSLLVGGARISFRLFDRFLGPGVPNGRRTLIYGAGDRGVVALYEILSNRAWGLAPIGFVDDDPFIVGRKVQGLPVLPDGNGFEGVLRDERVQEVVLAKARTSPAQIEALRRACLRQGVQLRRLVVALLEEGDTGGRGATP